jgi:hypothetical protein
MDTDGMEWGDGKGQVQLNGLRRNGKNGTKKVLVE